MTTTHAPATRELVTFQIGHNNFCVDIMAVREIRGWTQATLLPHAPAFICGVINLRGAVLSIVDLASRMGFPATVPSARHVIIVVQIGERTCGLVVDAVTGILAVEPGAILPTPDVASQLARDLIGGVLAIDERMISLVRLDSLLPPLERQAA